MVADTPKSIVALARCALLGTLFYVLVMYVAFLFIQPDVNPLYRFNSQYSLGRMGWLMKLAFCVWGVGMLTLALAMAKGLDAAARSRTAIILFAIGGVGVFLPGIFDADLQVLNPNPPPRWIEADPPSTEKMIHALSGMVGLLSLMAAAGFATRRLRLAGRLRSKYYVLRYIAWLALAGFLAFVFFLAPAGFAGLGQRVFGAFIFAWQIVAAHGLATGAFSPRQ